MADDSPTPNAPQPAPATAPPGAPGPEGAEPTPASPTPASSEPSELERLRTDHARTREELIATRATLQAFEQLRQGPQQAPEQAQPLFRFTPSEARQIAQQLGSGWTEEHVQQHAPIFAVFLQAIARPLLSGIEGMADVVDLIQARQEVPKYETMAEAVDRVRNEYRMRGQVITRKQAVAAVQSQRMQDPKYMDELLAEREKEKAAEQQRRAASATAAITEGGATVQKAGPEPTKQPRAPQSKEEFARLPLEEKRKVMEGLTI